MRTLVLSLAITLYLLLLADDTVGLRPTPICAEDAVLIGTGEFENGRWQSFECGPARDDYVDMPM